MRLANTSRTPYAGPQGAGDAAADEARRDHACGGLAHAASGAFVRAVAAPCRVSSTFSVRARRRGRSLAERMKSHILRWRRCCVGWGRDDHADAETFNFACAYGLAHVSAAYMLPGYIKLITLKWQTLRNFVSGEI